MKQDEEEGHAKKEDKKRETERDRERRKTQSTKLKRIQTYTLL